MIYISLFYRTRFGKPEHFWSINDHGSQANIVQEVFSILLEQTFGTISKYDVRILCEL